jgi:hypothetical protein
MKGSSKRGSEIPNRHDRRRAFAHFEILLEEIFRSEPSRCLLMYCVSDITTEIGTIIFEYLNQEDLVEADSACNAFWGSITKRVASSVISGIISRTKPFPLASIDCASLPGKTQVQRIRNGLKPRPSFFFSCRPLQARSYSRVVHTTANTTKLSVQLESPFRHECQYRTPEEFHPCENGPEPIEVVGFSAHFTSVHLPPDLGGTLRLDYTTLGQDICDQLYDVPLDQGCISRTISHRLSGLMLEWNTEGMRDDEFVELPIKWAPAFLQDHIDVMIRFEKTPALTHWRMVGWQVGMQTIECTPWVLKDFKATWMFSSVPPSIAQAVNDDSQERLESDNPESQVEQTVH